MRTFDELVEEQKLTFKVAPEPDGSYEIELNGKTIDISWGWHGENAQTLSKTDPSCIWTVLDCDGELYVSNGAHYVNRLFYLVTNEPFQGDLEDFIF